MARAKRKTKADQPATPKYTVDQLSRMSVDELTAIYKAGTLPLIADLDGTPPGRMLTIIGPFGQQPLLGWIRDFAASSVFPWAGKAFESLDENRGSGINRVQLAGRRFNWFPFETRVQDSAIDGKPCLFLDYDTPENPLLIRKIWDELREVSPGLFLGPAMLNSGDHPKLVLYFAVDKSES